MIRALLALIIGCAFAVGGMRLYLFPSMLSRWDNLPVWLAGALRFIVTCCVLDHFSEKIERRIFQNYFCGGIPLCTPPHIHGRCLQRIGRHVLVKYLKSTEAFSMQGVCHSQDGMARTKRKVQKPVYSATTNGYYFGVLDGSITTAPLRQSREFILAQTPGLRLPF